MSEPITSVVVLKIVPGRRAEVEQRLDAFCRDVASNDPGTLTYVVVRPADESDGDTLAMYEEFRDADAAATHGQMAAELTAALAPLLRDVTIVSGVAISRAAGAS